MHVATATAVQQRSGHDLPAGEVASLDLPDHAIWRILAQLKLPPGQTSRARSATGFAGLFKRPAARWARVALVAVNLAAVTAFLLSYSRHGVGFGPYRIDLGVYRAGGRTWLHGADLYGRLPVIQGLPLPFTYPPIAAVLLAPLALLPMAAAGTLLTVGSIALAAVVLRMFLRRLAGPAAADAWAVGWLLPPACCSNRCATWPTARSTSC